MEERRENKRRVDCVVEMPGAYLPILIPSSLSMLTPVSTFAFPSPFFSPPSLPLLSSLQPLLLVTRGVCSRDLSVSLETAASLPPSCIASWSSRIFRSWAKGSSNKEGK